MARRKKETPEQLHADLMARLEPFTARERLHFQNLLVTDERLDLCFLSVERASSQRYRGRLAEANKKKTRRTPKVMADLERTADLVKQKCPRLTVAQIADLEDVGEEAIKKRIRACKEEGLLPWGKRHLYT